MSKDVRYSRIDNIEEVLKEFSNKSSYGNVNLSTFYKISVAWDNIAGATLTNVCKPIFYTRQILTIVVADSTWANEIMFLKSGIIKKIDDMLQIKVTNIVTKIGDVEKHYNQKIGDNVSSKELDQKVLTDEQACWIDNTAGNIENKELREKFMSILSTYVKTGGDIEI